MHHLEPSGENLTIETARSCPSSLPRATKLDIAKPFARDVDETLRRGTIPLVQMHPSKQTHPFRRGGSGAVGRERGKDEEGVRLIPRARLEAREFLGSGALLARASEERERVDGRRRRIPWKVSWRPFLQPREASLSSSRRTDSTAGEERRNGAAEFGRPTERQSWKDPSERWLPRFRTRCFLL